MHDAARTRSGLRRGSAILIVALVIIALLAILFVAMPMKPLLVAIAVQPVFSSDPIDISQMRNDPANGYFPLESAAIEAYGIIGPQWLSLFRWTYEANPWPNDPAQNEDLVRLLRQAEPAFSQLRTAFAAPFYLLPAYPHDGRHIKGAQRLGQLLVIAARHGGRINDGKKALQACLDTIQLGHLIGSDGDFTARFVGAEISHLGFVELNRLLTGFSDPSEMKEAIGVLTNLANNLTPLYRNVLSEYRHREYFELSFNENPIRNRIWYSSYSRGIDAHCRLVKETLEKPYWHPDVEKHTPAIPEPGDPLSKAILADFAYIRFAVERERAEYYGAIIALALRCYEVENDGYPATLDDLVPDYLEAVPLDSSTGEPFSYSNQGEDFLLYGYGMNARDDDATGTFQKGDLIIHNPRTGF